MQGLKHSVTMKRREVGHDIVQHVGVIRFARGEVILSSTYVVVVVVVLVCSGSVGIKKKVDLHCTCA